MDNRSLQIVSALLVVFGGLLAAAYPFGGSPVMAVAGLCGAAAGVSFLRELRQNPAATGGY